MLAKDIKVGGEYAKSQRYYWDNYHESMIQKVYALGPFKGTDYRGIHTKGSTIILLRNNDKEAVSLDEALTYTAEDYNLSASIKAPRFGTPEQNEVYHAKRRLLKPIPLGWAVTHVRNAELHSTWSDHENRMAVHNDYKKRASLAQLERNNKKDERYSRFAGQFGMPPTRPRASYGLPDDTVTLSYDQLDMIFDKLGQ